MATFQIHDASLHIVDKPLPVAETPATTQLSMDQYDIQSLGKLAIHERSKCSRRKADCSVAQAIPLVSNNNPHRAVLSALNKTQQHLSYSGIKQSPSDLAGPPPAWDTDIGNSNSNEPVISSPRAWHCPPESAFYPGNNSRSTAQRVAPTMWEAPGAWKYGNQPGEDAVPILATTMANNNFPPSIVAVRASPEYATSAPTTPSDKKLFSTWTASGGYTKPNEIQPSVKQIRKVPPWRIDKYYRYNSVPAYGTSPIKPLGQLIRPTGLTSPRISFGADCSTNRIPRSRPRHQCLHTGLPSQQGYTDPRLREGLPFRNQDSKIQSFSQAATCRIPEFDHSRRLNKPLPVPRPSPTYLSIAKMPPRLAAKPQHLLLVLDLNGTLVYRPGAGSKHSPRPMLRPFLDYCLSQHSVLIWASALTVNVSAMCSAIFTSDQRQRLLGEWARDSLDLTREQYNSKTQVYKRLERVWNNLTLKYSHPNAEKGSHWSQINTLLLDDSVVKAQGQPFNHIEVPEFTRKCHQGQREESQKVLGQVMEYIERARAFENVSAFVRENRFTVGASPARERAKRQRCSEDNEDGGARVET